MLIRLTRDVILCHKIEFSVFFSFMLFMLLGQYRFSMPFLSGAVFGAFLLWIAILDFHYGLIFDRLTAPLAVLSVLARPALSLTDMAAGAVLGALPLLFLGGLYGGGIGGGDIKFAAAIGLWLGWQKTALTLLLSFWAGGGVAAYLILTGRKGAGETVPFGPFLSLGAWAALLYGEELIAAYGRFWYE